MSALLRVSGLEVSYGSGTVVKGVDLEVQRGQLCVILGANGAGKSTIVRTIIGLMKADAGSIVFDGTTELRRMTAPEIHKLGIAWVPEGRQVWGTLSVTENLMLGAWSTKDRAAKARRIDEIFALLPRLSERRKQLAGSMSGGEQSMLAIARAMVSNPKLILMDEPSLGLAPLMVRNVFQIARDICDTGISILLVEQNARQALKIATHAYLLEVGRVVAAGTSAELASTKAVQEAFLGGPA